MPTMGSPDVSFDATCEQLHQTLLEQLNATSERGIQSLLDDAVLILQELKQLNRAAHVNNRTGRLAAQEAKQAMDEVYLQLQNYRYEALHLTKEIAQCEEMESVLGFF